VRFASLWCENRVALHHGSRGGRDGCWSGVGSGRGGCTGGSEYAVATVTPAHTVASRHGTQAATPFLSGLTNNQL